MRLTAERNLAMTEKVFGHVRNETTDLADHILAFDPKIFSCPEIAAAERERIFQTQPMMAAHASEIREPGEFITVQLNSSNVILTRKVDGTVGAFLNVCRHRGVRLVDMERGRRRTFTCKYHGWSYGNDGTHRGISFDDTYGTNAACAKLNLVELPVEERHGFIWVVEDPNGRIDVANTLGQEMDQAFSEFGFEEYSHYRGEVLDLPQNWKVMNDGLLDGYHVKFLHRETIAPYVYYNILSTNIYTEHSLHCTARKRIDQILDDPPGTHPLNRYVIFAIHLCPNSVLVVQPHHAEFWTFFQHPDGPHRSLSHLRFITPMSTNQEDKDEILRKNYDIVVNAVVEEDVPAGNGIQAAATMPFAPEMHLGRNEILNQLFHRNYDRLMDGAAPACRTVD